jgi:hypothetical protein
MVELLAESDNPWVRLQIAQAFYRMGAGAPAGARALLAIIGRETDPLDFSASLYAYAALVALGDSAVREALEEAASKAPLLSQVFESLTPGVQEKTDGGAADPLDWRDILR